MTQPSHGGGGGGDPEIELSVDKDVDITIDYSFDPSTDVNNEVSSEVCIDIEQSVDIDGNYAQVNFDAEAFGSDTLVQVDVIAMVVEDEFSMVTGSITVAAE